MEYPTHNYPGVSLTIFIMIMFSIVPDNCVRIDTTLELCRNKSVCILIEAFSLENILLRDYKGICLNSIVIGAVQN